MNDWFGDGILWVVNAYGSLLGCVNLSIQLAVEIDAENVSKYKAIPELDVWQTTRREAEVGVPMCARMDKVVPENHLE